MPTIEVRNNESGTTYRAKVRVKGCRPQEATFKTMTAAKRWAHRVEADLRDHKYFPTNKAQKTAVSELIELYLAALKADTRVRFLMKCRQLCVVTKPRN